MNNTDQIAAEAGRDLWGKRNSKDVAGFIKAFKAAIEKAYEAGYCQCGHDEYFHRRAADTSKGKHWGDPAAFHCDARDTTRFIAIVKAAIEKATAELSQAIADQNEVITSRGAHAMKTSTHKLMSKNNPYVEHVSSVEEALPDLSEKPRCETAPDSLDQIAAEAAEHLNSSGLLPHSYDESDMVKDATIRIIQAAIEKAKERWEFLEGAKQIGAAYVAAHASECNHKWDTCTGPSNDPRLGKQICVNCGEVKPAHASEDTKRLDWWLRHNYTIVENQGLFAVYEAGHPITTWLPSQRWAIDAAIEAHKIKAEDTSL